jgi:hypothetical protein
VKWFELLPDVVAVCGRSIDEMGIVASGAGRLGSAAPQRTVSSVAGRTCDDPGPYAMALKPQSTDLLDVHSVIADRRSIIAASRAQEPTTTVRAGDVELARRLQERGGRIVYTPLMTRLASPSR